MIQPISMLQSVGHQRNILEINGNVFIRLLFRLSHRDSEVEPGG